MAKWLWTLGGLAVLGVGGYIGWTFLGGKELFQQLLAGGISNIIDNAKGKLTDEYKKIGVRFEINDGITTFYDIKTGKKLTDAQVQKRVNDFNGNTSQSNFTTFSTVY